jgi:hypothetical protein
MLQKFENSDRYRQRLFRGNPVRIFQLIPVTLFKINALCSMAARHGVRVGGGSYRLAPTKFNEMN